MPFGVYAGAGIAQGAAAIPGEVERRKEARARTTLSEAKLAEYQQNAPVRESQRDLEVQQLKNDLRTSQAAGMQQMTYESFNSFDADKNVRHLNTFLQRAKQNPMGARMFADATRFDKVTRTPENEKRLRAMGITDLDGYFEGGVGNLVLGTNSAGEQQLLDMSQIYAKTGYTKMMSDEAATRAMQESIMFKNMQTGKSKSSLTALERVAKQMAKELNIPYHEAYQQLSKSSAKTATTELERLAQTYREADPELTQVEAMEKAIAAKQAGTDIEREAKRIAMAENRDYNEVFEELKTRKTRTTAQKSIDEINVARANLDKAFEGDFLSANLNDPTTRSKAGPLIARIEKDFPMSTKDRATAIELRQLTSLASKAGEEITDAEAGPLDSLFRNVKKYISNDISSTAGPAAYEAFRNTMRHALAGSAQSTQETANFQKAMGSLNEQLGPVLVKLKTQVEELKAKLQGVYDMNDPYVAKYRLNMSQDQIAKVINALEDRIDTMTGIKPAKGSKTLTPGPKKELSEYFNR